MRFSLSPNDCLIRDLVGALDRDEQPVAETWRQVGIAAVRLGCARPGYHLVRELARRDRARRAAQAARREADRDVLVALGSPSVHDLRAAVRGAREAREHEAFVLRQHEHGFDVSH